MKKFIKKLATVSMVSFFSINASCHIAHAFSASEDPEGLADRGNQKVKPECQALAQKWLRAVAEKKDMLLKDPSFRPSQLFKSFSDEIYSESVGREKSTTRGYFFEKYAEKAFLERAYSLSPDTFYEESYDWAQSELMKISKFVTYVPVYLALAGTERKDYPSDEAFLYGYINSIYRHLAYTERLFNNVKAERLKWVSSLTARESKSN